MTYPVSPPFAYTALPDFVFDQVLTYTVMNTLRDNIDSVASALDIEHEYDGGEGRHKRIFVKNNIVLNPTARQGNLFWWDGGVATDYDTPGVDTDQALNYNPANFNPQDWTGGAGFGPEWTIVPALSYEADLSEAIPIGANRGMALSAQMIVNGYVAGNMGIDVVCYDAANLFLGIIAPITLSADSSDTIFSASGTTPANTAYVRVRKWVDAAASATIFRIKKIQLNDSAVARSYNDDAHVNSYVSIYYNTTTAQVIPSPIALPGSIINYNTKIYDDPNADRVTNAGGFWKFTAERYMRLRVSAMVKFAEDSQWGNQEANMTIFREDGALGFTRYKEMDRFEAQVNPLPNFTVTLRGTADIELRAGEGFSIIVQHTRAIDPALDGDDGANWVDCEEI